MSFFKIKLRKTDRLYTKYIREIYNYTCQNPKCRRVYSSDNCRNLGVSHLWGRDRENTRFDDENCIPICTLPCHDYWGGEGRKEYEEFMVQKLGRVGYDLLMLRAHTRKDRDDVMDEFIIKKKLEILAEAKMKLLVGGVKVVAPQ